MRGERAAFSRPPSYSTAATKYQIEEFKVFNRNKQIDQPQKQDKKPNQNRPMKEKQNTNADAQGDPLGRHRKLKNSTKGNPPQRLPSHPVSRSSCIGIQTRFSIILRLENALDGVRRLILWPWIAYSSSCLAFPALSGQELRPSGFVKTPVRTWSLLVPIGALTAGLIATDDRTAVLAPESTDDKRAKCTGALSAEALSDTRGRERRSQVRLHAPEAHGWRSLVQT